MTGSIAIRGGRVLTDGDWVDRDVVIGDGRIADRPASDEPAIDASGCLVAPGLVDLQCNGAAGIDLRVEPEGLWRMGAELGRWGVTSWLPTIVTSAPDVIARAQDALLAGPPTGWRGASPLGLHLEGPFLSPDAAGAHRVDLLRLPSIDGIDRWRPDRGVRMVTMAPELPGALPVIELLASRGIVVSVGHSQASADHVEAAIAAGARSVTHLFNAMSPLHHREPGVAGVALSDERLTVGLIADGIHLDQRIVALAERALGDRLVLVSDAVALLGVEGVDPVDGVRLRDGTLAGSVLPLVQAVRNLVEFSGCSPGRALAAAGAVPAALLGDAERGTLRAGARGDAVVLDGDLSLVATVVDGETIHAVA